MKLINRLLIAGMTVAVLVPHAFGQQQQDSDRDGRRSVTISPSARREFMATLPDIRVFAERPTERFLVDLKVVRTGHPYKGERAERPHTGGHIYFQMPQRPLSADDIASYPAIYAVADGYVARIDYSFRLREMYEPSLDRRVANYRYGIGLLFAKTGNSPVELHYSIEPFVDPQNEKFYEPFILVKLGQRVRKGDVLARMYLPDNRELARKSHIHFNLIGGRDHRFMAPSIFEAEIVKRLHATWGRFGIDGDQQIPACMGYKLAPHENPFGTGAKDRL